MAKKIEYTERRGSILGSKVKCKHCGKQSKSSDVTYRFLRGSNRGKSGYEEPATQGPLCSNCSELPPTKIPWTRERRW